MQKMRCLIVEDEFVARKGLQEMLQKYSNLQVIGEAYHAASFVSAMQKLNPDLVFLDIMLRDENVLESMQEWQNNVEIVFTTAYAEYAIKSYEFPAIDYLLKPIEPALLERAVSRAYHKFLHKNLNRKEIYLRCDGKYHRIAFNDILFLEGMENYVIIQTINKKLICKCTMRWIENQLPTEHFLRIHRSYIIHKDKVDLIDKLTIRISDFRLPISRENRNKVYAALIPDLNLNPE
ncbi:MAG: response regulator transcription factor [Bacteroidetes bacterium]|nr:response regulator transcription factor [Bacteroidota bacterium]